MFILFHTGYTAVVVCTSNLKSCHIIFFFFSLTKWKTLLHWISGGRLYWCGTLTRRNAECTAYMLIIVPTHYSLWLWFIAESMKDNCAIQDPSSRSSCRSITSETLGPRISSREKTCPDDINTNSENVITRLKLLDSAFVSVGVVIDAQSRISPHCVRLLLWKW